MEHIKILSRPKNNDGPVPAQVDPEKLLELLAKFNIDPLDLIGLKDS